MLILSANSDGEIEKAFETAVEQHVAALAIGAYLPPEIMKAVHLTPEEAVQAFIDLKARALLGIHWGTFDLAEEPLEEPPGVWSVFQGLRGWPNG